MFYILFDVYRELISNKAFVLSRRKELNTKYNGEGEFLMPTFPIFTSSYRMFTIGFSLLLVLIQNTARFSLLLILEQNAATAKLHRIKKIRTREKVRS